VAGRGRCRGALARPQGGDLAIAKLGSIAFHLYGHRNYLAALTKDQRRYIGQGEVPDALP